MRAVGRERVGQELALGGVRFAGGDAAEGEGEAECVRGFFGEEALGKGARGLDVLDVIHQGERLERRIGSAATDAGEFARGSVESGHGRRGRGAFDKRVKAAAVERVAVVLHVSFGVAAAEGDGFPDIDRLVWADRRAADFGAEETTERERLIAQNFGVEAEAR